MLPQSLVFHSYFTINQQIVNLTCFCLWFLHKTRLIGYILPKKTIDSRYYTDIVPLTTKKVYSSSNLDIYSQFNLMATNKLIF